MRSAFIPASAAVLAGLLYAASAGVAQAGPGDKTTFSLRSYIEQDDNVSLVSDDEFAADPIDSTGAGVMLTVARRFRRTSTLEFRGSLVAFHTAQLSSDAEDFDVTGVVPRLQLQGRSHLGSRNASWNTSLTLRRDWLGGEGFSRLIDLGGSYLVSLTPAWSLGPSYALSSRDYDSEGFNPETTSRNALRHTLGISSQWLLPSPAASPGRLTISVSSQRNDADGSDFEFDGAVYGAQLDLPLSARRSQSLLSDFGLQASLSASDLDYDEFGAMPRRSDRRLTALLGLRAQVRKVGSVDFTWTHFDIDSNRSEFSAQRNLLRLGVTHQF